LTALLRGRRLGEPEPAAATAADAPDGVAAAATVTPPPQIAATASRLSSEFKWPSPPPSAQADQVEDDNVECDEQDEVVATEWTLDAGAASDVNEDEEDELPHLDDVDVVDVMAATAASLAGANSDERKETERRGDDEEQVAIPFRTPPLPPDRIALLLVAAAVAGPSLIWHKQTNKQRH
jgi:hypothetical protein